MFLGPQLQNFWIRYCYMYVSADLEVGVGSGSNGQSPIQKTNALPPCQRPGSPGIQIIKNIHNYGFRLSFSQMCRSGSILVSTDSDFKRNLILLHIESNAVSYIFVEIFIWYILKRLDLNDIIASTAYFKVNLHFELCV